MTDESTRDVSIRNAEPGDLAALADLRWQWVLENDGVPVVPHDEFQAAFATWAQENSATHRCFVARRGARVIGMAWLATVPRVPSSRALVRASGDVQSVYVIPAERDAGIGGRLIGAVLAHAFDAGLERVTVHSSEGAITAYTRAGFVASGRLLQATRPT